MGSMGLRPMRGKPKFRLDAVMMDLWVVALVSGGWSLALALVDQVPVCHSQSRSPMGLATLVGQPLLDAYASFRIGARKLRHWIDDRKRWAAIAIRSNLGMIVRLRFY